MVFSKQEHTHRCIYNEDYARRRKRSKEKTVKAQRARVGLWRLGEGGGVGEGRRGAYVDEDEDEDDGRMGMKGVVGSPVEAAGPTGGIKHKISPGVADHLQQNA